MKNKLPIIIVIISTMALASCSNNVKEANYVKQIEGQESEIVDLQGKLGEKDIITHDLKTEINDLNTSLSNLDKKNKELEDNNSQYREQLEKLKDESEKISSNQGETISNTTESLYSEFYRHKYETNDQEIENEIIYGMHFFYSDWDSPDNVGSNLLMGENVGFIQKTLNNIDWQVDNFYDLFDGKSYSDTIKQRIDDDEKYELLKKLTNKKYTIYSLDKKQFEVAGKLTMNERGEPFIVFDKPEQEGFFISGNYNHIPRSVNVLVNMKYNGETYEVIQHNNTIDINPIMNAVEPQAKNVSIWQLIECDINGDGTVEKVVNINNSYAKYEYITNNWFEMDYKGYMAILAILDEQNNIIHVIDTHKDIKDPMDVGSLFPKIHYVIDVDNDGVMEIITEAPVWEGTRYMINKVDIEQKSIIQDTYYTGM